MEQIEDDDELYRRLAPEHVNPDGTVNSAALKGRNKRYDLSISVDLARLTTLQDSGILPRLPLRGELIEGNR